MRLNGLAVSRRSFLKCSLAAGGAVAIPWIIPSRVLGRDGAVAAGEKISLGVIGLGSRCHVVLDCMLPEKDVQCVAVCDVQASRRNAGKARVDKHYGNNDCAVYRDFRELLARPDIDAVLIATGDHWHAPVSILAARAGKDVYSEKPCGMTIDDCRSVEETVLRYGRIYQAGTQRRSISNFRKAVQLARTGRIGKLRTLHASVYQPLDRTDWLPAEIEPAREQVDWDLWLGPSPWRPYNHRYILGRGWQGFHDFTAGSNLMDWGAHTVDLCQWANNSDNTMPVEYEPAKDKITARYANGVTLELNYGDKVPQQSMTNLGTCPVRFVGEEGWVETGDNGEIEVYPDSLKSELRQMTGKQSGINPGGHVRNFFDCVRARATTIVNTGVMFHSHAACFASAIAWKLGRRLELDPARVEFINASDANRLRSRAMREPWLV